jgi:class 3 adenylate cyclase
MPGDEGAASVPTGTVTFLFTDVEGSTRLWAANRDAMSASLAVHDAILREAIEAHGGYVFTTAGDSFAATFSRASDAVAAAEGAQHSLGQAQWPGPVLRVRMGLHLGEAEERSGDYFGPAVNTAARVEAAGHGGHVLLTEAVRSTAAVAATDLGVHHLRDVAESTRLFQLGAEVFGSLRVVDPAMSNLPVRPHPPDRTGSRGLPGPSVASRPPVGDGHIVQSARNFGNRLGDGCETRHAGISLDVLPTLNPEARTVVPPPGCHQLTVSPRRTESVMCSSRCPINGRARPARAAAGGRPRTPARPAPCAAPSAWSKSGSPSHARRPTRRRTGSFRCPRRACAWS